MRGLIAADLLKLRRRRGLWLSALLIPSGFVVLTTVLVLAGVMTWAGGETFVRDWAGVHSILVSLLVVLVGARLGSEERATGTLRYQLLTGTPRHRLYLAKIATMVIACVAMTAVAIAIVVLAGLILPLEGEDGMALGDVTGAYWNVLLPALCYGSVAFGVGAVIGSTGPAIATALVLDLIGINLLYALTLIDEWFRHVVLSLGIDRLTFDDTEAPDSVTFLSAIAIVLSWTAAFLGAGWLRLRRIEV